jgi:hypothetical protein
MHVNISIEEKKEKKIKEFIAFFSFFLLYSSIETTTYYEKDPGNF